MENTQNRFRRFLCTDWDDFLIYFWIKISGNPDAMLSIMWARNILG